MNQKFLKKVIAAFLAVALIFTSVPAVPVSAATQVKKATAVTLNKTVYTLQKGKSVTLKATISPKGATTKTIQWKSSKTAVATVSSKGKVTAKKNGTATITATVKGTKVKASCKIIVGTPVTSVKVSPKSVNVEVGASAKITASVLPAKATTKTLSYQSSNKKIVTVDSKGKIKGVKEGKAKITVTAKDGTGKSATVNVTVKKKTVKATSVKLDKSKVTLNEGENITLKATVSPKNATQKIVQWSSSKESVASVNQTSGKVTAKSAGTATITATVKGTKIQSSCVVTVKKKEIAVEKITVSAVKDILEVGETLALTAQVAPSNATNKAVTWSSENPEIASVSKTGIVTAKAEGVATIKAVAKDGSKVEGKYSVKVVPKKVLVTAINLSADKEELTEGETLSLSAQVKPANATNQELDYVSSDRSVATVDKNGLVTAVKTGEAIITATAKDGSNVQADYKITVRVPITNIKFEQPSIEIEVDKTASVNPIIEPENASNPAVHYSSSDPQVATVDENGEITAKQAGQTIITVQSDENLQIQSELTVTVYSLLRGLTLTADSDTVAVNGDEVLLKAIPIPESVNIASMSYTSENLDVATVSEDGYIKGIKNGQVTIKVTAIDSKGTTISEEKTFTVMTPVTGLTLDNDSCELIVGGTKQLVATVLPNTANNQNISYTSTATGVVSVNDAGLITAVGAGTAKVIVETEDGGFKKECIVTVKEDKSKQIVGTQEELNDALTNNELEILTIQSSEEVDLSIPKGDYSTTDLIVDIANGHLDNAAKFKSVTIRSISSNTYVERASNNTIYYAAQTGRVQIAEGADVLISVIQGAGTLNLENNGSVSKIVLGSENVNLNISGQSTQQGINVTVSASAINSNIATSQKLNISANSKTNLVLQKGAEDTIVQVAKAEQIPTVQGFGRVPVTILETGDLENVVGENQSIDDSQTVKIKGNIANSLEGVTLYVIPYLAEITSENIADHIGTAKVSTISDASGNYETAEVSIGNYYLLAQKAGYLDLVDTLILTSASQEEYNAEQIQMIEDSTKEDETGNLSGYLYDAKTGAHVTSGITVKIREGKNNISGEEIAETKTNAEGKYEFLNLPIGQYTLQVLDNRDSSDANYDANYITNSFNATVEKGDNTKDSTITHVLESEQVRFVLKWGDSESGASSDLDSHLIGKTADGSGEFHTYYSDKTYSCDGETYASLDVDDTDYEGPETTTVYIGSDGVYHFYVYDYANGDSTESKQLSQSKAIVQVFVGEREVASYNVPNEAGTLWYVCDFDFTSKQVIAQNKMSFWTDSSSDIGIDRFQQYKDELQTVIEQGTKLSQGLTDSAKINAEEVLKTAQNVYDTATEQDTLREAKATLQDWIQSYTASVKIYDIDDVFNYNYEEQDLINQSLTLSIEGRTETLPEDLYISISSDSKYEILSSDKDEYEKMIVVTGKDNYTCKYYIIYRMNIERMCSINTVSAVEGEQSLLYDWRTSTYWDDDDNSWEELQIQGYVASLPTQLVITPNYSGVKTEIKDSDKEGYEKMVVLSYQDYSRILYITYTVNDRIYKISEAYYIESDDEDEWEEDFSTSTQSVTKDGEAYYELILQGELDSLPENIYIKPYYNYVDIQIKDSDKEGYEKMAVLSYGELSRTYYIRYELSKTVCSVRSVRAEVEGTNLIYTWDQDWDEIYDDDDNEQEIDVLRIYGYTKELPENLVITPRKSDATVGALEDSDIAGYAKKVNITYKDVSVTYYIKYAVSSRSCSIQSITTEVNNKETSIDWYIDEDDDDICILYLYGYTETLPESLNIQAYSKEATIEMQDSDEEGYDKKLVISIADYNYTYYVKYSMNEDIYDMRVEYEYGDDEDSGTRYFEKSSEKVTDGDSTYYVLTLKGMTDTLPEKIYVNPYKSGTKAEVLDSDKEEFSKMIVLKYNEFSRTYYIRYELSDEACSIDSVCAQVDGTNLVDYIYKGSDYVYDSNGNEQKINVLRICGYYGYTEELLTDMVFTPVRSDAKVGALEDSDIEGYEKKVEVTCAGISKTYYLECVVSSRSCAIKSITTEVNNKETSIGWDTDWDYDSDGDVYILYLYGYTETLPENLNIQAYSKEATIEMQDSDKEGYEKKLVISIGEDYDYSYIYYIKYSVNEDVYDMCVEYEYTDDEDSYALDFEKSSEKVTDGDSTYYVLTLKGKTDTLPEKIYVDPSYDGTTAKVLDSDKADFSKMIVLQYSGFTRTYYIRYELGTEVCSIKNVYAEVNGTSVIDRWYTGDDYIYDDDNNRQDIDVLMIYGYVNDLPENIIITARQSDATVSIEDSDIEKYQKKVVITYKTVSRSYYIDYHVSQNAGAIDTVKLTHNDFKYILNWDIYWNESGQYRILEVESYSLSVPDLQITSKLTGAKVEIKDSDKDGYEKMVVIIWEEMEYVYYIQYSVNQTSCWIEFINSKTQNNVKYSLDNRHWDGNEDDSNYGIIYLPSQYEENLDDLNFYPYYREAKVGAIEESDREGYSKMLTIENGPQSMVYYLVFNY